MIVYGERTTVADVLLDACDHALSWIFDVLQRPTQHSTNEEREHEHGREHESEGEKVVVGGSETASFTSMETDIRDDSTQVSHYHSADSFLGSVRALSPTYSNNSGMDMVPLSRETSLSEAREVCTACLLY